MSFAKLGSVVAKLIAAGLLFAALGRHPYDYYTLLRWVVCGVSAFAAFQATQSKKIGWAGTLAIVALIFNPLIPFHLKRETWAFIDIAAAVMLLLSIAVMDIGKPRLKL